MQSSTLIVKWVKVLNWKQLDRIQNRLHLLMYNPPINLLPLTQYSICTVGRNHLVRLEYPKIKAQPLSELCSVLKTEHQIKKHIEQSTRSTLGDWKNLPFVHGDLSPRNILYENKHSRIWFIDPVLDLESYSATPAFMSPLVMSGIRSSKTDHESLEKVLNFLSHSD